MSIREDIGAALLTLHSLKDIAELYDHREVSPNEKVIPIIWPFRVSGLEETAIRAGRKTELAYEVMKAGKAMMRWLGAQLQPGERFTFVGRLELNKLPATSDHSDYEIVGKYVIRNKCEAKDSE